MRSDQGPPFQHAIHPIAAYAQPVSRAAAHQPRGIHMSRSLQIVGIAVSMVLASSTAWAQRALSFTVDNQTGHTLIGLYGGPSSSDEWGGNVLSQQIVSGDTLVVRIADARTCVWDFRYEFSDKDSYEEYEINICDIDGESFTIR
jgi:hypothetical protein